MSQAPLLPGKLPHTLLARLLAAAPATDSRVLVGPQVGEDAAVINMGDRYLIAKSDPITFATDAIGYYAVTVNANDIATMGGTPRWFLATLLLPERGTTAALVEDIFAQIQQTCQALRITLVGGHTEITVGLQRPILSGHMLGEVEPGRLLTSAGVRVGDAIVLTKGVPLEGIAIMARECAAKLAALGHSPDAISRWQHFLFSPGISIVKDAEILCQAVDVHAMHDPTEGGVATGIWELAEASGLGVRIAVDRLPILDDGVALCRTFGLDPLGTIASGALLAALPANQVTQAIAACTKAGINCYHIGDAVADPGERLLYSATNAWPLPTFTQDEIVKIFRD